LLPNREMDVTLRLRLRSNDPAASALADMPNLFIYAIVVGLTVLITLLVLLFFYPIAI
jgi:hypothetical protein